MEGSDLAVSFSTVRKKDSSQKASGRPLGEGEKKKKKAFMMEWSGYNFLCFFFMALTVSSLNARSIGGAVRRGMVLSYL